MLELKIAHEEGDAYIDSKMTYLQMPERSIGIINEGQLVYHRAKGLADREKSIAANEAFIIEGASISRGSFSATAFVVYPLMNMRVSIPHTFCPIANAAYSRIIY